MTNDPADSDPSDGGVSLSPSLEPAASALFGARLPLAQTYATLLATDGVVRGLIGPREAPRIWDRHLLNCAAVAELISPGASVVDVGSGAGLPGIVLAIARPDITVTLIEPLARRTSFLDEVVEDLDLANVTVHRGRAEEASGISADYVTARAVAPLDRLARWCLPLARIGGRLLAMKGSSAADEIAEHQAAVGRIGGGPASVVRCGVGVVEPPTTVVVIECVGRTRSGAASGSGSRSGSGSGSPSGSGSGSRKAARTRR